MCERDSLAAGFRAPKPPRGRCDLTSAPASEYSSVVTVTVIVLVMIVVANTLAAELVVAELATLKPMKTLSLRQRVQAPRRA